MKTIYYSHPISSYGSLQEAEDLRELERLGFTVVNPSAEEYAEQVREFWKSGDSRLTVQQFFTALVESCDALAFRALPTSHISAGVACEIDCARANGLPVIELPGRVFQAQRVLSADETRCYLRELGAYGY